MIMSSAERQSEVLDLVVGADGSGSVDAAQLARLGVEPGTHLSVVPIKSGPGGGAPPLRARSSGRFRDGAESGGLRDRQLRRGPGLSRPLPRRRRLAPDDPVRVVADTHALVWYLLDDPDRRLSPAAITALERAESTDGIAVSVASVVDLWYVIRTRGTFTDEQLDQVLGLLHDSETSLEAEPITLDVTAAFRQIPRDALGDPWDRFITATAMALGLPLVTRDGRIRESGLIDTIW